MKNRVDVFRATHIVAEDPSEFETSPACAEPWCRWVLTDSVAYAARAIPRGIPGAGRRQPLALPSLPDEAPGRMTLSDETKKRVAEKRREAEERKAKRQRLALLADEEYDPFGHGFCMDDV